MDTSSSSPSLGLAPVAWRYLLFEATYLENSYVIGWPYLFSLRDEEVYISSAQSGASVDDVHGLVSSSEQYAQHFE